MFSGYALARRWPGIGSPELIRQTCLYRSSSDISVACRRRRCAKRRCRPCRVRQRCRLFRLIRQSCSFPVEQAIRPIVENRPVLAISGLHRSARILLPPSCAPQTTCASSSAAAPARGQQDISVRIHRADPGALHGAISDLSLRLRARAPLRRAAQGVEGQDRIRRKPGSSVGLSDHATAPHCSFHRCVSSFGSNL
jgi:hypothetical protein